MANEYPTSVPTEEIAACIKHVVSGEGDPAEVAKCAWLAAGWFLNTKVGEPEAPSAKVKKQTQVIKHPSKERMLEYAEEMEDMDSSTAASIGPSALPSWVIPLIIELLNKFLNKP